MAYLFWAIMLLLVEIDQHGRLLRDGLAIAQPVTVDNPLYKVLYVS